MLITHYRSDNSLLDGLVVEPKTFLGGRRGMRVTDGDKISIKVGRTIRERREELNMT